MCEQCCIYGGQGWVEGLHHRSLARSLFAAQKNAATSSGGGGRGDVDTAGAGDRRLRAFHPMPVPEETHQSGLLRLQRLDMAPLLVLCLQRSGRVLRQIAIDSHRAPQCCPHCLTVILCVPPQTRCTKTHTRIHIVTGLT